MTVLSRRAFLRKGAHGAALAAVSPLLLESCLHGVKKEKVYLEQSYLSLFQVTHEELRQVLSAALARGGDYADLYFELSSSNSIVMEDHSVNRANSSISMGMGVRVLKGDKHGYSYTEELSLESMKAVASAAAAIADDSVKGGMQDFVFTPNPDYYPIRTLWEDTDVKSRVDLLTSADAKIFSLDSRVSKATLYMQDEEKYVLFADSEGRIRTDFQPLTRLGASVVAEENGRREQNGYNYSIRDGIDFYTPERMDKLARESVRLTTGLFEAVDAPVGEFPVVLAAGSSGILLHEAIGHGMEADFNRKGISIFSDKIDKKVAEPFVNIVDSGVEANMRGSINMDDEGRDSQTTALVENGILRSYLHDRISASHYGLEPTGNGRRESFKHAPLPRMRNTYMTNGPHSFDEIIESVPYGIYADQFTNGEVNIGAGDFTFYVKSGYLIENGKMTAPIKDVNIIGNGPDVLAKINMVADDFRFSEGGWTCGKNGQSVPVSLGLPTCKVSSITVGGKNRG